LQVGISAELLFGYKVFCCRCDSKKADGVILAIRLCVALLQNIFVVLYPRTNSQRPPNTHQWWWLQVLRPCGNSSAYTHSATSAKAISLVTVDPQAEYNLFEYLRNITRKKTTIFTSHRLTNVYLADRIIVLEKGCLIEMGTHDALLRNNGRYAELIRYQQEARQLNKA